MFHRINVWQPEERSNINSLKIFHLARNSTFFSNSRFHSYDSLFELRVRNRSASRSEKARTRRCTHCVRVVSLGGHVWPACAFKEKCGAFYPRLVDVHRPSSSKCSFEMLERAGVHGLPSTISSCPRERRTNLPASTDKRIPLISSFVFLSLLFKNNRINEFCFNNYIVAIMLMK